MTGDEHHRPPAQDAAVVVVEPGSAFLQRVLCAGRPGSNSGSHGRAGSSHGQ